MSAECRGRIVRAHTIQRGGGLSRIAEKGKVLTLMPGSPSAFLASRGRLKVRSVGIGDASTFTGFCEKHDGEIFAPLEKQPFTASPEQNFLLYYRAVCHEAYKKRAHAAAMEVTEDQTRRMKNAQAMEMVFLARMGALAGARDMDAIKARLDANLLARDFGGVESLTFLLSDTPSVVCAGATAPEADLAGSSLQDLGELEADLSVAGFALIPTDAGGAAVLSWARGDLPPRALAESFLRIAPELVTSTLVHFAFEYFENTYFSPVWWRGLTAGVQRDLETRAHHGVMPTDNRPDLIVPVAPLPLSWSVMEIVRGYDNP